MHERFAQRIETGLRTLTARIARARQPLDRGKLERQIGRLLERNTRAAGRYTIDLVDDRTRPAGLALQWSARAEWDEWARHSEGCYVLRTNIADWDVATLWRTYVQLTDAEAAFRIQKSELSIRPIWHQRTDRVQAHIFVCFLAYVLWKTLEQPADLAPQLAPVQGLPGAREAPRERLQARLDSLREARVHRLFLLAPFHRPAQHEGFRPVGARAELRLHAVAHRRPVRRRRQRAGPLPQLALRRAIR